GRLCEQLLRTVDVERRAHCAVELERLLELLRAFRAPARLDQAFGGSETKPRLPCRRAALGPRVGSADEIAVETGEAEGFPAREGTHVQDFAQLRVVFERDAREEEVERQAKPGVLRVEASDPDELLCVSPRLVHSTAHIERQGDRSEIRQQFLRVVDRPSERECLEAIGERAREIPSRLKDARALSTRRALHVVRRTRLTLANELVQHPKRLVPPAEHEGGLCHLRSEPACA